MRTLGQLGEVAGMAAIICKKHSCTPREVYREYLDELIAAMEQGVETPDAFACSIGHEECYHLRDIGWWYVDRCKAQHPEAIEKYERGVEFLGLKHKYPKPEKWEKV